MTESKMKQNQSDTYGELAKKSADANNITPEMYSAYAVKRGLRDLDGRGVLTGLTDISEIHAYEYDPVDGEEHPAHGKLYYRGYDVRDLAGGFIKGGRCGFEETAYLLCFGECPTPASLIRQGAAGSKPFAATGSWRDSLKAQRDMMNALGPVCSRCIPTTAIRTARS